MGNGLNRNVSVVGNSKLGFATNPDTHPVPQMSQPNQTAYFRLLPWMGVEAACGMVWGDSTVRIHSLIKDSGHGGPCEC